MVAKNYSNFGKSQTLLESEELNEEDTYLDEASGFTEEEKAYLRFIRSKQRAKKKWDR